MAALLRRESVGMMGRGEMGTLLLRTSVLVLLREIEGAGAPGSGDLEVSVLSLSAVSEVGRPAMVFGRPFGVREPGPASSSLETPFSRKPLRAGYDELPEEVAGRSISLWVPASSKTLGIGLCGGGEADLLLRLSLLDDGLVTPLTRLKSGRASVSCFDRLRLVYDGMLFRASVVGRFTASLEFCLSNRSISPSMVLPFVA